LNLSDLLRPVQRGLARLRTRVRSLLLLHGSSRTLVFLVVALLALFAADYLLRLPLGVRRLTFMLLAAGLLAVVYRRLVRPLREPLHDAALAARVEARYPRLENRLISSLAFLEAERDPENADSPALMRAVVAETAELAPGIDFGSVARARTPLRWAAGAVAILLFASALAAAQPGLARTFAQRNLLLRDVSWPRRTTLAVLDMEPGVAREVTLNHDTEIAVRAEGALPDRVILRYRERGGRDLPEETLELAPSAEDPALFTYTLHVDADYEFSVTGGDDDRAETYVVQALTPPAVTHLELACTYPAYLGLEPEVRADGDQRVPEGTIIELRATVNMDLRSASFVRGNETPAPMEAVGERTYGIRLAPTEDLRYSFLLEGPRGQRNEPHTFVIRLSRDTPPDLRIRAPGGNAQRVADGFVLISFRAHDDHRIDAVRFRCTVGDTPERVVALGESGGDAIRFLQGDASDPRTVHGLVALDLAQWRGADGKPLDENTVIAYTIEIVDSAGKQSTSRNDRRIQIAPPPQVEENIESRKRDLHDSTERAETQSSNVTVELMDLASASPTTEGSVAFSRQLGRSLAAVGRLVNELGSLSGQMRGLLNVYVFNRLDDKATAEQALPFFERHLLAGPEEGGLAFGGSLYRSLWEAHQKSTIRAGGAYLPLFEMADLGDRLASETAPAVYKLLRDASRPGVDEATARALIAEANEKHAEISDGLQRLRRLMREWQNYEGVLRGFRRLRNKEQQIVEELKPREK